MNRRSFLKAGIAAAALPRILIAGETGPMARIAMSTVTFRFRFRQTNPEGKGTLTLLEVPEYYADRFKLTNIEFWSKHFESQEKAYLDELKAAIQRTRTTLINIQVDERYNLAEPDEQKRKAGIASCKRWLNTTAYMGAPSMRVNTGQGKFEACVASIKELNAYAQSKGLLLLVENHGGLSSDPDVLLKIHAAVGSPNFRILADFANFPPKVDIYGALKKLYPHTHLISAKTKEFNAQHEHISFDFDRCVRLAEESGFKGIYSAEQWAAKNNPKDFEKASDWMIEHLKANIR
jgi:sugar phosphate isomerase/epimerase